jgi:hypothetical protein
VALEDVDVDDGDTPGAGLPAAPAMLTDAVPAGDSVAVLMDTVVSVVPTPAPAGAGGIAPILRKEPAPQRHWQSQDPSACVAPWPLTTAPGEPTESAGCAAAGEA